jgi:hypothetical protein
MARIGAVVGPTNFVAGVRSQESGVRRVNRFILFYLNGH